MKSEEIKNLFSLFESAASEFKGIECWSARELQKLLGYSKWENFEKVISKAKESCANVDEEISNHFPDVRKVIEAGKGALHEIDDILLTRYACYLIAQNGDSRKEGYARHSKNEEEREITATLKPYPKYNTVYYDYASELPDG